MKELSLYLLNFYAIKINRDCFYYNHHRSVGYITRKVGRMEENRESKREVLICASQKDGEMFGDLKITALNES